MRVKLFFDNYPERETDVWDIIKGRFPQHSTDPKIIGFRVIYGHVGYGQPFEYVVNFLHVGPDTDKLKKWLAAEDFEYILKWDGERIYYHIRCDDCADAAKIETYLNTEL